MISEENLEFLRTVCGVEAREPERLKEFAKEKFGQQLFDDFEYCAEAGFNFRALKGYRMRAERDGDWLPAQATVERIVEAAVHWSIDEEQRNPVVFKLRQQGWRCYTAKASTHLSYAYLKRKDRIEPMFITSEAAWAALVRSQV